MENKNKETSSKQQTAHLGISVVSGSYLRPDTVGDLLNALAKGITCEVVSTHTEIVTIKLNGWLNFKAFKTYPSKNKGWDIFEAV